jgi:hypothetical protein
VFVVWHVPAVSTRVIDMRTPVDEKKQVYESCGTCAHERAQVMPFHVRTLTTLGTRHSLVTLTLIAKRTSGVNGS